MEEFADITLSQSSLRKNSGESKKNPDNPNDVNSTEIIWTKDTMWETAEAEWTSSYQRGSPTNVPYIKEFRVGIVNATTSFKHISNGGKTFVYKKNNINISQGTLQIICVL